MRKLWIILMIMIFCVTVVGWSQQVIYDPTPTADWDTAVYDPTVMVFYAYELGVMDSVTQEEFIVGATTDTQHTWDISSYENIVYLGVRTVVTLSQDMVIDGIEYQVGDQILSVWNWSHEDGAFTPNPFVCKAFLLVVPAPNAPEGFRVIQ